MQQHHGLKANEVPLDLLRAPAPEPGAIETRAVTPGPTNVGVMDDEVLRPVFAMGSGAFLGIHRPTVAAGDAVYPVLTTRPTVGGPHSASTNTDVPETTGAFTSDLLAPERIQASFLWSHMDAARFPAMSESLRAALTAVLEEKLDYEAIQGTNRLLAGANLASNAAAAITTFADYLSRFCYGRIDGRYAMMAGDVRILMGAGTYAHAGATYRANEDSTNALDRLMEKTGGVRVSAHVPAVVGFSEEVERRFRRKLNIGFGGS